MCAWLTQTELLPDLEEIPQEGHFSYQKVNISTSTRQVGPGGVRAQGLGMSPKAWERMGPRHD